MNHFAPLVRFQAKVLQQWRKCTVYDFLVEKVCLRQFFCVKSTKESALSFKKNSGQALFLSRYGWHVTEKKTFWHWIIWTFNWLLVKYFDTKYNVGCGLFHAAVLFFTLLTIIIMSTDMIFIIFSVLSFGNR